MTNAQNTSAADQHSATALDYLIRASDAFVATLPLLTPNATRVDNQRAWQLAQYAWRCAERASAAAGTDPAQIEVVRASIDMADRAQVVALAIRDTRLARTASKVA